MKIAPLGKDALFTYIYIYIYTYITSSKPPPSPTPWIDFCSNATHLYMDNKINKHANKLLLRREEDS
jgi:hypothetical protein